MSSLMGGSDMPILPVLKKRELGFEPWLGFI
jgi:hypothetical protein